MKFTVCAPETWGGRHEKVLRYRLFAGIGIERCRLRGQRQVPGWQGKSSSASRRNEGLVPAERRAGLRGTTSEVGHQPHFERAQATSAYHPLADISVHRSAARRPTC